MKVTLQANTSFVLLQVNQSLARHLIYIWHLSVCGKKHQLPIMKNFTITTRKGFLYTDQ